MLTTFIGKHKRKIHQLFNLMWENVDFIRKQLVDRGYAVGPLVCGVENYVSIDGRLEPAHYHTPEFGFSYGVVGCTLDGLCYVVAVGSTWISEVFLKEIIESFPFIKMYGGKDFKRNFYPCPGGTREIIERIKSSGEETIQLNITVPNPWDRSEKASIELLGIVEKLVRILRSHKIRILNPLESTKYRMRL